MIQVLVIPLFGRAGSIDGLLFHIGVGPLVSFLVSQFNHDGALVLTGVVEFFW